MMHSSFCNRARSVVSPATMTCNLSAMWKWGFFTTLFLAMSVSPVSGAKTKSAPFDLAKGSKPPTNRKGEISSFNVGPTGFSGWVQHRRTDTSKSRQIYVTAVEKGSPADGKLQVGDVILGADGTGATGNRSKFTSNARISIGKAITDAEARNPANLALLVWRNGKTFPVTLTLKTVGAYSATAPYDCEKSKNLLLQGVEKVYERNKRGWCGTGILILLAADDPTNPNNEKYQARAKEWAHQMIDSKERIEQLKAGICHDRGAQAWSFAYRLLVLAEYYLKTKDQAVFETLEAHAMRFALGTSNKGTTGHGFSDRKEDGSPHGPMTGYGAINGSGVPGFLGLILARKAGVKHEELQIAINNAANFFGSYAYKSMIPYGENPPCPQFGYDMNGKSGTAALAFMLLPDRLEEARFFARMAMNDTDPVSGRLMSHAGPYFNYVWPPLGAAIVGPEAANYYLKHYYWHYDLSRRWDGNIDFDAFGSVEGPYKYSFNKGNGFLREFLTLMTYALPLRNLHITGRDHDKSLWLSKEEFTEACADNFVAAKAEEKELLAALGSWDPIKRMKTSSALVKLYEKSGKDQNELFSNMKAIAQDKNQHTMRRHAAVAVIDGLRRHPARADTLVELLHKEEDEYVRLRISEALFNGTLSADNINGTLKAMIKYQSDNGLTHSLAGEGFGHSNVRPLKRGIPEGVDRKLVWKAMAAIGRKDGLGLMSSCLSHMTEDELLENANVVIIAASTYPRNYTAVKFLQKRRIAEGVPLAIALAAEPNKSSPYGYQALDAYGESSLTVEPDPEIMQFLFRYKATNIMVGRNKWKDVHELISRIMAAKEPKPLTYLKEIESVSANPAGVNLPGRSTTLQVKSHNYAVSDVKENQYTWRKLDGPGKVSFTPNGTWDSKDTNVEFVDAEPGKYRFEVTMSDTYGLTIVRDTVSVTLRNSNGKMPANRPPKATPQTLSAIPGIPVPVVLSGVDPDGKPMSYHVISKPAHGTISGEGPQITYTAHYGHEGNDTFTFKAVDSHGETDTATITVKVAEKPTPVTVFEPFDYPAGPMNGTSGNAGFGWTGKWTIKACDVQRGESGFAKLPTAGGLLHTRHKHPGARRGLDVEALNRDKLLDDGGQLCMSIVLRKGDGAMHLGHFALYLQGKDAVVGFRRRAIGRDQRNTGLVLYDGKDWGSASNATRLFPKSNSMFILRCRWNKDPEDVDTIELYRVFEYPAGQPYLIRKPASRLEKVVAQKNLDTFAITQMSGFSADDIRIGPTLESVLRGTAPSKK